MKTIHDIQQDLAKESGYEEWFILLNDLMSGKGNIEWYIRELCRRYAEEAIEECAKQVELLTDEENPYRVDDYPEHQRECLGDGRDGNILAYINRDSILNVKQQLK